MIGSLPFRFGLLCLLFGFVSSAPALGECFLDSDGNGLLTQSAQRMGSNTVKLELGDDVSADRVQAMLEQAADIPIKVRKTKEGLAILSKEGAEAIESLLAKVESDCNKPDPWLAIASLDFGGSKEGLGANLRAKKKKSNATLDPSPPNGKGRFAAEVLDVYRGPYPEAYLHLKVTQKGGKSRREGERMLAIAHLDRSRSGQPRLSSQDTVTNLQAYYLLPGDHIAAEVKGRSKKKGIDWWVLNPVVRVDPPEAQPKSETSFQKIQKAFKAGEIGREAEIEYKVYSIFDQRKLPQRYRSDTPNRGATMFLKRVRFEWDGYSKKLQNAIAPHLPGLRPNK